MATKIDGAQLEQQRSVQATVIKRGVELDSKAEKIPSDTMTFEANTTKISIKTHPKSKEPAALARPVDPRIIELEAVQKDGLQSIAILEKAMHGITTLCKGLKDPQSSAEEIFLHLQSLPECGLICHAVEQALPCDNGLAAIKQDPFLLLRFRNYDGLNLIEQVQEHLKGKIERQHCILALADLELFALSSFNDPLSIGKASEIVHTAMDKFEALPKEAKRSFCYKVWELSKVQTDDLEFAEKLVLEKRDISMFVSFKDKSVCKECILEFSHEYVAPLQFNTMYVDQEGLNESDPIEVRRAFHQLTQIKNFLNFLKDPYKLNDMSFMTKKFNELDPELKEILPSLVWIGSTYPDQLGQATVQSPIDFDLLADLRDVAGRPILEKIAERLHAKIQAIRQLQQLSPLLQTSLPPTELYVEFKQLDPALLKFLHSRLCESLAVDHFNLEENPAALLPIIKEQMERLENNARYVPGQECFQPRIDLERMQAVKAPAIPQQPEQLVRFSAGAIKSAQVFHQKVFPGGTHHFNSDLPLLDHEITSVSQDEDLQHLVHKVAKNLPSFKEPSKASELKEKGISAVQWGVFEDEALPEWTFQITDSAATTKADRKQVQRYSDILQTVIEKEGLQIDLPKLCIIPTSGVEEPVHPSLFVILEKKAVGEDFRTAFNKLSVEDQKRCSRDLCRLIALTGFDALSLDMMSIHQGRIQIHAMPLNSAESIEGARANARTTLLKLIEQCKKEYVTPWDTPETYDEGFIILRQAAEEQFTLLEEKQVESPKSIKAFRSFAQVMTDPSSSMEMKQAAFGKLPQHLQEFLYFAVWGGLEEIEQIGDKIEEIGKKRTLSNLDILTHLSSESGMNLLEQIETRFTLCETEELFRLTRRCLADEGASPLVFHAFVTTLQQSLLGSSLLAPIAEHLDKHLVQIASSKSSFTDPDLFEEIRKTLVGAEGKEGLLDTYIRTLDSSKRRITCFAMSQRIKLNRLFKQDAFPVKPVPFEQIQVKGEPVVVQDLPKGMKVLLVAYECSKYGLKLGGLGEAIYGMAKSLKDKGCEVTILMPKFAGLPKEIQEKMARGQSTTLRHMVAGQMKEDRVWTFQEEGLTLAYLEDTNAERNMFEIASGAVIYKDGNLADQDRPWHGLRERMAYVGSAAAEYIAEHRDDYDAVIYNDWHAAYAIDRLAHRHFDEWVCGKFPANVFVVHNNSYGCQGVYGLEDRDTLKMFGDERDGLNVMLEAIELADRSVTVSETFAHEMQEGPLTSGIGPWVRRAAHDGKFKGIINGSNPDLWNPETNKALKEWKDPETGEPINLSFSPQTKDLVAHKQMVRLQLFKAFQKHYPEALKAMNCQTPEDFINHPLILYVGRYDASQKGLDKFKPMMEAAHAKGGHFICMGTEEINGATEILDDLAQRAAELQCGWITRGHEQQSLKMQIGNAERGIPALGPLIRAAADFCLVPSCFEPCGLVQSEGWLFGAPAIGTKTGGLADTIVTDQLHPRFNGFTYPRLYDWNSPDQDRVAGEAVTQAIEFWTSLGHNEKNEMIARLMTDGRQLSWTTSPSGLSPVDRYLVTIKEAIEAKKVRQTQPVDMIGIDETPLPEREDYFGAHLQTDLYTKFGAHILEEGVQFRVMAPAAKSAQVVIIEPNGLETFYPMQQLKDGSWQALIEEAKEGTIYQYEIETAQGKIVRKNDPFALGFEPEKRQASKVVASPNEFKWTDQAWMETRKERKDGPVNIYEVHVPSWFKPDNKYVNFVDIAKQLGPYCKKMGFTHVELYGLCEHFVDQSMGYQVSGYFAPTSRNGSLKDFQEFVNIMHESGISVIYDFVPAHFVIDDCSLRDFDGTKFFEESDIRNRDSSWGTLLFNFNRNDVRNFLLSSARFFLDECHLDGIRVDAVAHFTSYSRWRDKFTWNPGPDGTQFNRGGIQFARDFNRLAHSRDALTIAENSWRHDFSDTSSVDDPSEKGLGFDLRFNMEARSKSLHHLRSSQEDKADRHSKQCYQKVMCDLPKEKFMGPYLCHDEIKIEDRGHIVEHIAHEKDTEEDIQAKVRLYFAVNAFSPQHARMSVMGTEFGLSGKWDAHYPLNWQVYEQMPTYQAHQKEYARINHFYLEHPAFWSAGQDLCHFSWVPLETEEALIANERRDPKDPTKRYLVVHNFANKDFEHVQIRAREQAAIEGIKEARIVFRSDETDAEHLGSPQMMFAASETSDNIKPVGMDIGRLPKYSTVVIEEVS